MVASEQPRELALALKSNSLFGGRIDDAVAAAEEGRAIYRAEAHHATSCLYGNHDPGVCALSISSRLRAYRPICIRRYPTVGNVFHIELHVAAGAIKSRSIEGSTTTSSSSRTLDPRPRSVESALYSCASTRSREARSKGRSPRQWSRRGRVRVSTVRLDARAVAEGNLGTAIHPPERAVVGSRLPVATITHGPSPAPDAAGQRTEL